MFTALGILRFMWIQAWVSSIRSEYHSGDQSVSFAKKTIKKILISGFILKPLVTQYDCAKCNTKTLLVINSFLLLFYNW